MPTNAAPGPKTAVSLNEWADDRGVRDCLQWFTREKQWINEIHLQLCRVPAPTLHGAGARGLVPGAVQAHLGWEASIDRAGNVIAAAGDAARTWR